MNNKYIQLEQRNRLLITYLNNPSANLITTGLVSELKEICLEIEESNEIDVMIIGSDKVMDFSQGTSPELKEDLNNRNNKDLIEDILNRYRISQVIGNLKIPVISAIQGKCYGQGLELALATDIRIGSEESVFSMDHVSLNTVPWDGGTQRLPRIIGIPRSLELILTSRQFHSREALDIGMLHHVVPQKEVLEKANEIAEMILTGGSIASKYAKEVINTGSDMTLDQGILLETDLTMILQTTKDRKEGIDSFLERRPPNYTGE